MPEFPQSIGTPGLLGPRSPHPSTVPESEPSSAGASSTTAPRAFNGADGRTHVLRVEDARQGAAPLSHRSEKDGAVR